MEEDVRDVTLYLYVRSANPSKIFGAMNLVCVFTMPYGWHSNDVGGESYSPEVSQTSIEESFPRADGTGSRSFPRRLVSFATPLSRASLVLAIVWTNYAY